MPLQTTSATADDQYQATMLWAACCLGYFGFMWAGDFTAVNPRVLAPILVLDVAIDHHSSPSMVRNFFQRVKTDPFGKGISIYLGKTNFPVCHIATVLHYLAVHRPGEGPLFVHQGGPLLTRDQFVRCQGCPFCCWNSASELLWS